MAVTSSRGPSDGFHHNLTLAPTKRGRRTLAPSVRAFGASFRHLFEFPRVFRVSESLLRWDGLVQCGGDATPNYFVLASYAICPGVGKYFSA